MSPSSLNSPFTALLIALAIASGLMLSVKSTAFATTDDSRLRSSGSAEDAQDIEPLFDRCSTLARSPHWTDAGFVGVSSSHRFAMTRLCDLAERLLNDPNGDRSDEGGLVGRIVALPPVERPSAFASACREEARSGPRSLRALNWRNSPHQTAKMALCDRYERALTAKYLESQSR